MSIHRTLVVHHLNSLIMTTILCSPCGEITIHSNYVAIRVDSQTTWSPCIKQK